MSREPWVYGGTGKAQKPIDFYRVLNVLENIKYKQHNIKRMSAKEKSITPISRHY